VAAAGSIIGEHHITGSETPHSSIAGFNLDLSGQGDDVLTPRRRMVVAAMGLHGASKNDAFRRVELGKSVSPPQREFNVYFFEMRFVICAGV
jgi:hypothetical protein